MSSWGTRGAVVGLSSATPPPPGGTVRELLLTVIQINHLRNTYYITNTLLRA